MLEPSGKASLAVFCGPSLPVADRIDDPGVDFLPPAGRGDVERASREYGAVLLIDGVFHHDLAPTPKECFAATRRARCFGASSMGALRAVECRSFGFVALGAIARWYATGIIDGDDEVAVLVNPKTHEAMTVPSVNVRFAAWLAHRRGLFSADAASQIVHAARSIFYMDRTWDDVFDLLPPSRRAAFRVIAEAEGDLKRLDARFALRTVTRKLGIITDGVRARPPLA